MTLEITLLLISAYFLGSIPFGVLVARAKGVDIMKVGSGNIGATNVMRTLGSGPAFLVFFLDAMKGLAPTLVARAMFPDRQELWLAAGAMAIIGHSFSPFLKFKGGKGIATALGMVIGTSPWVALGAFIIFTVILATTRYMSLASIFAVTSTLGLGVAFGDSRWVIAGYLVLTVLIVWRHRANVERLKNGTEPRFEFKKTVKATSGEDKETSAVAKDGKERYTEASAGEGIGSAITAKDGEEQPIDAS